MGVRKKKNCFPPCTLPFGSRIWCSSNRKEIAMPRPHNRAAKTSKTFVLLKPKGELTPRVKKVGPQHFGIVAVDCAKARSRLMLADFFGQTLLKPVTVPHTQ